MFRLLSFCLIALFVIGCEKSDFEVEAEKHIDALEWIVDADPEADFEEAIDKKDYRFKGVYGNKNLVPGVSMECLNVEKDVDYIKGTSEILWGYEHTKLNAIAYVYAQHYNSKMAIYLLENEKYKKYKCNL